MNRTRIEWVRNTDGSRGWSWNPVTGCRANCDHCHARSMANSSLRSAYLANINLSYDPIAIRQAFDRGQEPFRDPFFPRFWINRLPEASRGSGRGILACDMGDLFGAWIPREWTSAVKALILGNQQNRFYLHTRHPDGLRRLSPYPENAWVGVTATHEMMIGPAVHALRDIKASVKFLSLEPMEHIPLSPDTLWSSGINWVIVGASTKPPEVRWIEQIVESAVLEGIPVFIRDNLAKLLPPISPFSQDGVSRQDMPTA